MHPVLGTTNANFGDTGAFATASMNGHGFVKSFTEHGVILGFVNCRADLTYQQGLDREFSRDDKLDYFWPKLANIGEQAVLTKEIYCSTDGSGNDIVFGYQGRSDEYRYKNSYISGLFRSNATAPLDAWHLSQEFANTPVLNEEFIVDEPPIDRVVNVTTEPHFIADFYFGYYHTRTMPTYGIPGSLGRF